MSTQNPEATPRREATSSQNRRMPSPAPLPERTENNKRKLIATMIVVFLVGIFLGALIYRQKHHAKDVVAVVGGKLIVKPEFYHRLEVTIGRETLQTIITGDLTIQYAEYLKVMPPKSYIDQTYNLMSHFPMYQKQFESTGLNPQEIEHDLRVQIARAEILTHGAPVTDQQMLDYYETNIDPNNPKALFYMPEEMQVAIIVCKTRSAIFDAQRALNSNVSFSQVAKEYSVDPSKQNGGLVGSPIQDHAKNPSQAGFVKSIFQLRIGQTSNPMPVNVLGHQTYWIVRCLDKSPMFKAPFDAVKEQCTIGVLLSRVTPAMAVKSDAGFQDWVKKSNVQIFWPDYQSLQGTIKTEG